MPIYDYHRKGKIAYSAWVRQGLSSDLRLRLDNSSFLSAMILSISCKAFSYPVDIDDSTLVVLLTVVTVVVPLATASVTVTLSDDSFDSPRKKKFIFISNLN